MERINSDPRPDWRERVEEQGLIWHTAEGKPYWNESAYYAFSADQVGDIERATAELYRLCLEAGQFIIDRNRFHAFGIPPEVVPLIKEAWEAEPPALNYGRFDLGYDGRSAPKMFEFNADTPTSLLEASVIQWDWLRTQHPDLDQFNSIHDRLICQWSDMKPLLRSSTVHFAHAPEESGEDAVTVAYMRDVALAAGIESVQLPIDQIGWDGRRFVDLHDKPIEVLFHLYPWEWLINEKFGQHIAQTPMQWVEPIWKMIWSNKALLPILWEIAPDHPNLLRASFSEPTGSDIDYVRKPILAREGANVSIFVGGHEVEASAGDYDDGRWVYQALYNLPDFDGSRPVIGSWVVDGAPAGMGIREGGLITGNTARFVPHVIR